MSPGSQLSHAARTAFDGHRCIIAAVQHLEAASADLTLARDEIAELIEDTAHFAAELQRVVNGYRQTAVRNDYQDQRRASA